MSVRLPIEDVLTALCDTLTNSGRAVLIAPPGAGKTTRVPLALMDQIKGRIVMLEPRRLAARAAAERMASTIGEVVGRRIGYRMRGESVPGSRIEVVTEGVLTRMIQSDPGLAGVGAVIFDEFHERSLNSDLGLALVWEARGALRPDLAILVMSATLDAEPVAALLDHAPVIRSQGRAWPVETRWLDRPLAAGARFVDEAARLIIAAEAETRETGGTLLAFLPGEGEIRRVSAMLAGTGCEIVPLFGALKADAQNYALSMPEAKRRIVLATAIAETSLTIPAVRVVVDTGQARRARFDPGTGMSRLVTERASRAEADQRRGRAGRIDTGTCYRMWSRAQEGAMPAFAPPEITIADLSALALELAAWGSSADDLAFLTPPPDAALTEARNLLAEIFAIDHSARITAHGKAISRLPLHPRLGHMLLRAGRGAAGLAALLSDRDPIRGAGADMQLRLSLIRDPKAFADRYPFEINRPALQRITGEATRLRRLVSTDAMLSAGSMAALAYPDRIGMRRSGQEPRFLLSGGKGAMLDAGDPLANQQFIVAVDVDAKQRDARIRMAVSVDEAELRQLYADKITTAQFCEWSRRDGRVAAHIEERLGALILSRQVWHDVPETLIAQAAFAGLRQTGLNWSPAASRLRARISLGRDAGLVDEARLLANADWLLPWLGNCRTTADLRKLDLVAPLQALIGWEGQRRLDEDVPAYFVTPLGRKVPIDYDQEIPSIELRLQELFGVTRQPVVGGRPLRITLLSPGGKPVQVTMDLPGFWQSSYSDVRKDMRSRYPRHPWPEDPTIAEPTTRAKPRGT